MFEVFGYGLIIVMGLLLSLFGGGGSILIVPILVYLFKLAPELATTYSLLIVGSTALSGAFVKIKSRLVDFKAVLTFIPFGILGIIFSRAYLLKTIPDEFSIFGLNASKQMLIMGVFALVMLSSSIKMIKSGSSSKEAEMEKQLIKLILVSFCIGVIMGFVGAGGGFLIVPALHLFFSLDMKKAVASSLFVIALQSLIGGLAEVFISSVSVDWLWCLILLVVAFVGVVLGSKLSEKIDSDRLKKYFGYFVLAMAVFIFAKEFISL